MIIPNSLIKLDYDPVLDVLSVEWPDFYYYSISEAAYTLDIIIETVKQYDVKYLLTDTRKSTVDITTSQYKEIILKFAKDLATTRLQKVARVVTESTLREKSISEVKQEAHLTVPIRNFGKLEEALQWLTAK
jgi:6-pyruvoyl-tetrahydropterin synthase